MNLHAGGLSCGASSLKSETTVATTTATKLKGSAELTSLVKVSSWGKGSSNLCDCSSCQKKTSGNFMTEPKFDLSLHKSPLLPQMMTQPSAICPHTVSHSQSAKTQDSVEIPSSGKDAATYSRTAANTSLLPPCTVERQQFHHYYSHPHQQHHEQPSASRNLLASGGIPLQRYRAKLEECADLHRRLQDTCVELSVTREHLCSVKVDRSNLINEIERLRDVLFVTTTELQSMQQRVEELERENKHMSVELRGLQALSMCPSRRMEIITTLRATPYDTDAGKSENIYGTNTDSFAPGDMGARRRLTNSAAALCLESNPSLLRRSLTCTDTLKPTDILASYVCECFRTEVVPHMELLHSLYDGSRLMAVDPPVTHAQLSALKRVLVEAAAGTTRIGGAGAASIRRLEKRPLPRVGGRRLSPLTSAKRWNCQVELLSFRCENWHASTSVLLYMIRSIESVRHVEIFSLTDVAVLRQLAEALLMAPHVEVLSLPELSLADDGLAVLFSFMVRQEQLVTKAPASIVETKSSTRTKYEPLGSNEPQKGIGVLSHNRDHKEDEDDDGAGGIGGEDEEGEEASCKLGDHSAQVSSEGRYVEPQFSIPCLDLSRCRIDHPTGLFRTFRGPLVKVLVLTGCSALRDAHVRDVLEACPQLHTIDLSGNEGLTTACVRYISQHERLKVLRLENCPAIKRLELANVEVLFSSLAYVTRLYAPELCRLPVPLTQSHVLFDLYAPKLREIILKGIVVDRGTLAAFVHNGSNGCAGEREVSSSLRAHSSSARPVEKNFLEEQQQQEQQPPRECEGEDEEMEEKQEFQEEQQEQQQEQQEEEEEENQHEPGDVPQLLSVGFIGCLIASASELNSFMKQQTQLLRLSLHGCHGLVDSSLAWLPHTLMELDLGGVAQLTGSSVNVIATRLPQLIKLSLKNAGTSIQNADLHRLRGLGNLEVLNLLGLPQLFPEVVAAVVEALPQLRVLYHETVVVARTHPTTVLQVNRIDEEDTTHHDIQHCLKELLQLRNETALALWMEAQLPKPAQLLPCRNGARSGTEMGAKQPPLTINTTFYEATQLELSQQGRFTMALENEEEEEPSTAENGENTVEQEKPDVLTISSDHEEAMPHEFFDGEGDNDEDDENEKSKQSLYDTHRRTESGMDEKSRLAIEQTPLGPWGAADIVAEHRQNSGG
ncbi:putative leucine-rich repeat protein [Trypanosoma cruzi]|uniref:Leucine-rich repeat protein, putative n=2 Tax=Trypanosoma cruzi TaxID=5693 RepID=Q4DS69_TRYCC|nr:leucine-rich repeat protein, putative [Trypanosoma cruzi]EAN95355.1 leucine-rich repeat protein, putative [Trypanosoma cruzi]PWV09882.1 putative leucine-rich repeat protein [Trypanosoma cruzi]RNC58402.1 putative leucine-rich repeat protein [Trypanosoma cruzi]|eukprot:XP_817206.1 leucine-rich repeat protein [Trypanosoma cruzi strain CL Brener]